MIFNVKNIFFLFVFLSIEFSLNPQSNLNSNEAKMLVPYNVLEKILLDLNHYDQLKDLSTLQEKEIIELDNKNILLKKINLKLVEKDSLCIELIKKNEDKFNIVLNENKSANKEIKRLKTKNTLSNIISGIIIAPLVYLILSR